MPLSIKSETADQLARALAAETGESLTEAALPVLDPSPAETIVGYDADGLPE